MDRFKTGNFIAKLRSERGMTQTEAAEKLGVSNKTVSRWENGQTLPDFEQMQKLCELYDVRIEEILAGERISTKAETVAPPEPPAQTPENPQKRSALLRTAWSSALFGAVIGCAAMALLVTLLFRPTKASCGAAQPLPNATEAGASAAQTQNAEPSAATEETEPTPSAPSLQEAKRRAAEDAANLPAETPQPTSRAARGSLGRERQPLTVNDFPEAFRERRLSDGELEALRSMPPAVLRERISTVADIVTWFNLMDPDIWDSNVISIPRTGVYYYLKPEEQLRQMDFASDSLALSCAWLIQEDYEGLCVLYVNGVNCMNNMCVAIPNDDGWLVFDPAAFTYHGSENGALDCVCVQALEDLYPILDRFNVLHHEYLMPISVIENLEQEVAFYENVEEKYLCADTDAVELARKGN